MSEIIEVRQASPKWFNDLFEGRQMRLDFDLNDSIVCISNKILYEGIQMAYMELSKKEIFEKFKKQMELDNENK